MSAAPSQPPHQPQSPSPSPARRPSTPLLEQAAASDASITAAHAKLLRERHEPEEGFSGLPILILFVFSALIFYGGIYLGRQSGEFSPLAFDATRDYALAKAGPEPVADPRVVGARVYNRTCFACHQPNGQGVPPAFPPLAGSDWVSGSEDRLIRIIAHGLSGPVEVGGQQYNNIMPPQGLNAQSIAAVLTYIRSEWGNTAPPVTVEKVQEVLGAVGARTQPWTAAELQQVP